MNAGKVDVFVVNESKTAWDAFAEVYRGEGAGSALRRIGIDPDGPVDQVQRLRDEAARAAADAKRFETYRDEAYEEVKRLQITIEGLTRDVRLLREARDGWCEQSDKPEAP